MHDAKLAPGCRSHARGGKTCAQRLELRHGLEQMAEIGRRDGRDDRAAMRAQCHEPRDGQVLQRLAHRRPGHAEGIRQLLLVELGARQIDAVDDRIGEPGLQIGGPRPGAPARYRRHPASLRSRAMNSALFSRCHKLSRRAPRCAV